MTLRITPALIYAELKALRSDLAQQQAALLQLHEDLLQVLQRPAPPSDPYERAPWWLRPGLPQLSPSAAPTSACSTSADPSAVVPWLVKRAEPGEGA